MPHSKANTIAWLLVLTLQSVCWLIIALWFLGKIVSDRFLWSQFLSWIPTVVPLAAMAMLWLGTCVARKLKVRGGFIESFGARQDAVMPRRTRWCPGIVPITTLALFLWLMIADIRLHSLITGLGERQSPVSIRLLCWNATSVDVPQMAAVVKRHEPDIAILTNTPFNASLVPVREQVREAATAANKAPDTFVASSIRLNVISRFPVLHHAVMSLGITGAKERTFTWVGGGMKHIDTGQLMCVELDTTKALGKATILWVVDLPSDPDIPRARMMREFQAAVAGFPVPIMRRTEDGVDRVVSQDQRSELLARLQHPDLIAGDFNTTRDSASLSHLLSTLGTFKHAKDQATGTGGVGWDCTYPRTLPLLHIDHVFVSASLPVLKASNYSTFDPYMGRHSVQVVDLHLPK